MKKFFAEFKQFISKGNILDMAVGVVIGSAFGAIVTALVNILLSICLWRVPGGLKGLVTVLPAANDAQKGMNEAIGLGQKFAASDLQSLATKLAETNYADQIAADSNYLASNPNLIESAKSTIIGKYTLHGSTYTYNLSSVIDWGTFINAIISFLIIAFVLFVIVKAAMKAQKMRENATDIEKRIEFKKEKGLKLTKAEEKFLKEKEEAEAQAALEAENEPEPEVDPVVALLSEIRDSLKKE